MAATMAKDAAGRETILFNAAREVAGYVSKGLDRATAADELSDMAIAYGFEDADEVQTIIADAFQQIEESERPRTNGKSYYEPIVVAPSAYLLPDPAGIPSRKWLEGRHYMRGIVTATVAPGGFGKTSLSLFETLEMVKKGLRVWYISAEDDRDELDRRIAAYVERHKITPMQVAGNLYIDDKLTFPFKIARMGKAGPVFDQEKLTAFEAAIADVHIDVVIFDPFISFHYLPENDTAAMDAFIKRLGEITARQNCCIELSHHVRKPNMGQAEITVYDARGAGAIVNAVRSCRVLNVMNPVEVEQVNAAAVSEASKIAPDQRFSYLRIDSGKRNMAPPEKARWVHLVSIEIANGDHVQAVEQFDFPKVFSKITTADVNWIKHLLRLHDYRADSRSSEWIGHPIAERFGRIPTETCPKRKYAKGDIKWINSVISAWENNKVFARVAREDEHRKPRDWFVSAEPKADVIPMFQESDNG